MLRATTASIVVSVVVVAAPATAQTLEARLTFTRNQVEVGAADRHPAQAQETLARGARVHTGSDGAAEVTLSDASRLRVGENTTLVMFAPATTPPAGTPPSNDTTLVRGRVRVVSAETGGAAVPVSLATPGGLVVVHGEALIFVDAGRTTRVSVFRGRARVRAANRDVVLRAGTGVRVDAGRPPLAPRPLAAPPTWAAAPPAATLSAGAPVDVRGTFAPGAGPTAATQWRLQLARDERFNDLVVDRTVAARITQFEALALAPGSYWARVSGVDAERFEGMPSPAVPVVIASPRIVPGGNGRRATVEIPRGFYCGLDGAVLMPAGAALQLAPARNHVLRCSTRADGAGAVDVPISAAQAGPLVRQIRVDPAGFDSAGGMRLVVLQLADGAGLPIPYANITTTVSAGAAVEPFRETDRRGTYTATVRWQRGIPGVRLRIRVNDADEFDYVLGNPPAELARE